MKIYIELLIPLALIFLFLAWKIWYKWTERRLKKKYKPENDRGRKGQPETERTIISERKVESNTEELGTREPTIPTIEHEQHEGRKLLQDTSINDVGKIDNSSRKVGFFRRRT